MRASMQKARGSFQECARAFAYPASGQENSAERMGESQIMDDLLEEMRQCKSVRRASTWL